MLGAVLTPSQGAPRLPASLLRRRAEGTVRIETLGVWLPRLSRNQDGSVTVEEA